MIAGAALFLGSSEGEEALPPDLIAQGVDRLRSTLATMLPPHPSGGPPSAPAMPLARGNVLGWLKARANARKGAFDPDLFAQATPFLSGWSITPSTALVSVNGNTYDSLRRLQELAGVREKANGKFASPYAMGGYKNTPRDGWWAISRSAPDHLPIEVVPEDDKGRPYVARPVAGTLYVTTEPEPGQWGQGPLILWVRAPAIGVPAWIIRAPDGRTLAVQDKPRGRNEPIAADGVWKWAYAAGLADAARAALPTPEQERAAERAEAIKKGLGSCGVCFNLHALHTRSGLLVQHGYSMAGGHGHGHGHHGMWKAGGDCFGVGWRPYEKSNSATEAWAEECALRSTRLLDSAREWEEGKHTRIWLLHTETSWGPPTVHECGPGTIPMADGRKTQRIEVIGPDHKEWASRVAHKVREMRAQSVSYAEMSRRYAEIAKGWPAFPSEFA